MKIAVDVCLGKKRIEKLKDLGYDVVVVAQDSESDISWLTRASEAGAIFCIGNDGDIPRVIENNNFKMIWIKTPKFTAKDAKSVACYQIHRKIKFRMDWIQGINKPPRDSIWTKIRTLMIN